MYLGRLGISQTQVYPIWTQNGLRVAAPNADWFSLTMTHVSAVETSLRHRGVTNNWADPRVQQLNFDSNGNNELDEDPLNSAHGPVDDGESDVSSLMGRKSAPSRSGDGEHPWRRPEGDASSSEPAVTRPRSALGLRAPPLMMPITWVFSSGPGVRNCRAISRRWMRMLGCERWATTHFLSALMQEVWVLMTHTVEPSHGHASSASRPSRPSAEAGSRAAPRGGTRSRAKEGAGARPTNSTTPTTSPPGATPMRRLATASPPVLGVVDGSGSDGSDVEVEVDGDALAVEAGAASAPSETRGKRVVGPSSPLDVPMQSTIDLLEDGEEESQEVDPLLVDHGRMEADDDTEDDAEDDDVSHMQVSGTSSLASAIQPVRFAMVLDTLSRALERLVDDRRRLVSGLLLRRLRGRLHAVTSLTGQMLEALLVTFEPFEDTRLEDSAEADVSWASYWWDVVATHLPEAQDAPHTVVDSVQSDATCPVVADSAQLVATSTTDAVAAEAECGSLPNTQDAARPAAVAAATALPIASSPVALVGTPGGANHGGPASFAVELVVRPGGAAGAGMVAGTSGSTTTSMPPPPSESVAAEGTSSGSLMEVGPVRVGAVQPALTQGGVTEGPAMKKPCMAPSLTPSSAPEVKVTVRVEW